MKGVCMTARKKSNSAAYCKLCVYHCEGRLKMCLKQASQLSQTPSTTFARECPIGICRDEHPGTTSKDVKLHAVCNGNERSIFEANKSRTVHHDPSHVAILFLDNQIVPYDIWMPVFADNRMQLVSKFFQSLCTFFRTKHLTRTAYHLQSNWREERLNEAIIARLWHCAVEHQWDWDIYVQPLKYAWNAKVPWSTNLMDLSLFHA